MLTATILAASASLAAATTVTQTADVGYKQTIDTLDAANDVGVFTITGIHNGGPYNPTSAATTLNYVIDVDTGDIGYTVLNGGSCPTTAPTAFTNPFTAGTPLMDTCLPGSEDTAVLAFEYTADEGLTESFETQLKASYVTFTDGDSITQYVPVDVAAGNGAFYSYEYSYPSMDQAADPSSIAGFVLPSLIFNNDPSYAAARGEPWFLIDFENAIDETDPLIGLCIHKAPLYAANQGTTLTPADCKSAAMATATADMFGYYEQTVAGDLILTNPLEWEGRYTNLTSTAADPWYVTPFISTVGDGYFKIAMEDTQVPVSASGFGPSMAVAGLVAAVAKMLA